MIAGAFRLVPLTLLHQHEATVLRRLDSLPVVFRKEFLRPPELRYALLYYLLFTYWPELVSTAADLGAEESLYNRYYWLTRLAKEYQASHGYDAGLEQQAQQVRDNAEGTFDLEMIREIEERVAAEFATNEKEIAVA